MGYSLYICHKCLESDAEDNVVACKKGHIHANHHKCIKAKTRFGLTYDETYNILSDLKIYGKYISGKTLASANDKLRRDYLERFNRIKPDEPLLWNTIWLKFWNDVDYLIQNYNDQNKQEFKDALTFVHDLLY